MRMVSAFSWWRGFTARPLRATPTATRAPPHLFHPATDGGRRDNPPDTRRNQPEASMKRIVWIIAASAVGLAMKTAAIHAQAGPDDHLICYTMKDSFKITRAAPIAVDLVSDLQPEFSQRGCTLLKPFEFCVPANKTKVTPAAANVNPGIIGQPLQNDYICYVTKCPKQVGPSSKLVTDQFATHRQRKYQPVTVCVPAVKKPVGCPVGATGITGAAMCGGACPDPTQTCQFDRTNKTCTCKSPPKGCSGKPNSDGVCGGACTAPQVCLPGIKAGTTTIECECQNPPPPGCTIDPVTGTCGGTCPTDPTKKCGLDTSGQCSCVNVSQPCMAAVGANGCGGTCDLPGQQCHPDATGICTCASPCGPNPLTGTCGGGCSVAGETCLRDPVTGICTCEPPTNVPCSVNSQNVCTGTCPPGSPPGAVCGIDPATGACNCSPAPPPCGPALVANSCVNGACPAGSTCKPAGSPTAPTCGCQ